MSNFFWNSLIGLSVGTFLSSSKSTLLPTTIRTT
jgi:hypothetical protein